MEQAVDDEISEILAEADPGEAEKLAAFAAPDSGKLGDYVFHAFNAGRKLLLILSGVDQKIITSFTRLEASVGADKLKGMSDAELGAALLAADPEAYFHFAVLAFICVQDAHPLAIFREKPETLEAAAFEWQDGLADDIAGQLIGRSAGEFFKSTVGQDFQVAGDGKPPDPNGPARAGSRSTPPPASSRAARRTGTKRSGAKSPSVAAGKPSTSISP